MKNRDVLQHNVYAAACGLLALSVCAAHANSEPRLVAITAGSCNSDSWGSRISSDGAVVVGTSANNNPNRYDRPFLWRGPDNATFPPGINDFHIYFNAMYPFDVSDDGRVIVGETVRLIDGSSGWSYEYSRWTWTWPNRFEPGNYDAISGDGTTFVMYDRPAAIVRAGQYIPLGSLPERATSKAIAISRNGTVVCGVATQDASGAAALPFRWTRDLGMTALQLPVWSAGGAATAMSNDGRFIAGLVQSHLGQTTIVRWDASNSVTPLFDLNIDPSCISVRAISDDGRTIVGNLSLCSPPQSPFFWREGVGLRALGDEVRRVGLPQSASFDPRTVTDMTADGRTFIGAGNGVPSVGSCAGLLLTGGYLVTLPCLSDYNANNSVDFFDYLDFMQDFSDEAPKADLTGDGVVDLFDYLPFVEAFDRGC
jgi:uncharacterized membrane protein